MNFARIIGFVAVLPGAAWAFEPDLSDAAQMVYGASKPQTVLALPTGRFEEGGVPTMPVTGLVKQQTWRVSSGFVGTAALAETLAKQATAQDYEVLLSCDDVGCGGFDFRFSLDVLLPPNMFVDLSDYYFVSAKRETNKGPEGVTILVSRTVQAGMVQIDTVSQSVLQDQAAAASDAAIDPSERAQDHTPKSSDQTMPRVGYVSHLEEYGHVVLDDLAFATGASRLSNTSVASLKALASFLNADARRRVALVGHTDTEGSLSANVSVSQRRASAVRRVLIETYGVAATQLEAHGAGYLSPIASNATEAGRMENRRVEAVLLGGGS
ncbi:OmpA family protein [Shimia marina]|uniref:Outer membrane porin F n=1 Tax=Shimia marina TaxID=321267 RepID=A0A0P1EKF4_9RHOB|nr:OmpA family protein [Shimia marina]CUH51006.1 Outer membrane porin F precursor [Shimia marina]SFD60529.1 OmpA family protein [Shimia marina]